MLKKGQNSSFSHEIHDVLKKKRWPIWIFWEWDFSTIIMYFQKLQRNPTVFDITQKLFHSVIHFGGFFFAWFFLVFVFEGNENQSSLYNHCTANIFSSWAISVYGNTLATNQVWFDSGTFFSSYFILICRAFFFFFLVVTHKQQSFYTTLTC